MSCLLCTAPVQRGQLAEWSDIHVLPYPITLTITNFLRSLFNHRPQDKRGETSVLETDREVHVVLCFSTQLKRLLSLVDSERLFPRTRPVYADHRRRWGRFSVSWVGPRSVRR